MMTSYIEVMTDCFGAVVFPAMQTNTFVAVTALQFVSMLSYPLLLHERALALKQCLGACLGNGRKPFARHLENAAMGVAMHMMTQVRGASGCAG